jgi:hypothetical protein
VHNEELQNFSLCQVDGAEKNAYRLLVGKLEGKRPLERPSCGWITLQWILKRQDRVVLTRLTWLRTGPCGWFLGTR